MGGAPALGKGALGTPAPPGSLVGCQPPVRTSGPKPSPQFLQDRRGQGLRGAGRDADLGRASGQMILERAWEWEEK